MVANRHKRLQNGATSLEWKAYAQKAPLICINERRSQTIKKTRNLNLELSLIFKTQRLFEEKCLALTHYRTLCFALKIFLRDRFHDRTGHPLFATPADDQFMGVPNHRACHCWLLGGNPDSSASCIAWNKETPAFSGRFLRLFIQ